MYKQAGLYVRKTIKHGIVYNIYTQNFSHPWIILLPGLPQYVHKQAYLKQLTKSYSVLVPYYPGSFHSDGKFTVKNVRDTLPSCLNLIRHGNFYDYFDKRNYQCNTEIKYILGLSFGGNVLFDYMSDSLLENIIPVFVSPMFNISSPSQSKYCEEKLNFLESQVYKNVYRGLNKERFMQWMKLLESKTVSSNQKGQLVFGRDDKYMEESFLEEKFPMFTIKRIFGYSQEVASILEHYIQYNLNL